MLFSWNLISYIPCIENPVVRSFPMKAPTLLFRSSKSPFSITTGMTFLGRKFNLEVVPFSVCRNHDSFKCPQSTIDFVSIGCSKTFLTVTTDSTFPTNFSLGSSKNVEELTSGNLGVDVWIRILVFWLVCNCYFYQFIVFDVKTPFSL